MDEREVGSLRGILGMPDDLHRPVGDDPRTPAAPETPRDTDQDACRPACPVCGGRLLEIRGKLECRACHTIVETCCEGGPSE